MTAHAQPDPADTLRRAATRLPDEAAADRAAAAVGGPPSRPAVSGPDDEAAAERAAAEYASAWVGEWP